MKPQDYAALGTMFREAIEKHVKTAVDVLSESFGKALQERDEKIAALEARKEYDDAAPLAYNDAEIKGSIADMEMRLAATHSKEVEVLLRRITELEGRPVYDPQPHVEASAAVLRSIGQINERIDTVAKSIPAPYDDAGLIDRLAKQLEALREEIPAAYDDAEVRRQVADLTTRTNTHAEIVKGYADNLPKPYDDTSLRAEVAEAMKFQTSAMESVTQQVKELSERQVPTPVDGRDALQLEVLPAIDKQKSYTRGTYAKHAGGLWRAFEQTSGMRGWECIVDGVASLTAEMHGKSLVVRAIQSSGTEAILHAALPVQTYKGVFAHGEHEQGDTVTWAGSLWHCNVTGTKALPGDGSSDWTLAVKKGRDGREVVKTERAQGPVKIGGAE